MESKERAALVEQLAEIFSERRLPGTRNGPITEPRDLAGYVVAALAKARGDAREFHLSDSIYFRLEGDGSVSIVRRPKAAAYFTVEKGFHDPETLLVAVDAHSWDSVIAFTRGSSR